MRETAKAAAAYATYEAMGVDRSLAKLAERLHQNGTKTVPTLNNLKLWSTTHGWQRRVAVYDAAAIEKQRAADAKQHDAEIAQMRARHAQIGVTQESFALRQLTQLAARRKVGAQAAVMLLKLAIDVERTARGEPTTVERHEQVGAGGGPIQHEQQVDVRVIFEALAAALAPAGPEAPYVFAAALTRLANDAGDPDAADQPPQPA